MANELQERKEDVFGTPSIFRGIPEFPELLEGFFGNRLFGEWPSFSRQSMMNMRETEKGYFLSADVPGIPQKDIDISISGNVLTIRGENKSEEGDPKSEKGFTRQYRHFQQSLTLPTSVEEDKIEAAYENGVLEVYIPKSASTQARKIQIQSDKAGVMKRFLGKDTAAKH